EQHALKSVPLKHALGLNRVLRGAAASVLQEDRVARDAEFGKECAHVMRFALYPPPLLEQVAAANQHALRLAGLQQLGRVPYAAGSFGQLEVLSRRHGETQRTAQQHDRVGVGQLADLDRRIARFEASVNASRD